MRMRRAQNLAVGHSRQRDVIGVDGLAGDLAPHINALACLADDAQIFAACF